MHLITDNLQKIILLCQKYGVKTLSVFGSILTDRFNEKSDIDFSVTFFPVSDPLVAGDKKMQFYIGLQDLMGQRRSSVEWELTIISG